MKIQIEQVKSIKGDRLDKKRTWTSSLVIFLIQVFYIPVTITEEKIIFKLIHWKTVIYFSYILGFHLLMMSIYYFDFLKIKHPNKPQTNIQQFSYICLYTIKFLSRTFPLILSHGLQKMKPKRLDNKHLCNPKQTTRIILSCFMYVFGILIEVIDLEQLKTLPAIKLTVFGIIHLIVCSVDFLIEALTPFLIQILAQDFIIECQNVSDKENFMEILEWYQEFKKSLQLYCLSFYSYYQFIFIFHIYRSSSVFTTFTNLSVITSVILLGKTSSTLSLVWNIVSLTTTLDSVFDSLQLVKEEIQERMRMSSPMNENYLKYILEKVKSLKPISACGYFEISKSILTSMLSVRYLGKQK